MNRDQLREAILLVFEFQFLLIAVCFVLGLIAIAYKLIKYLLED